ncbi:MAG: SRPBCC domain-containing protein [Aeromicrobium sp.]
MNTDTVTREISIHAPIDRVWSLVTQAEHLGAWFGDSGADIGLRPGGAIEVRWDAHSLDGVVQVVESGFDALDLPEGSRRGLHTGHTEGWAREIAELGTRAAVVAA